MAAVLIAWLAWINRKWYRSPRVQTSSAEHKRFPDIFREGLAAIRRCPLVLIIPVGACIIQFAERFPSMYRTFQMRAQTSTGLPEAKAEEFIFLFRSLHFEFLKAAGQLPTAMLSGFLSVTVSAVCLFGVMFVFLRFRSPDDESEANRRRLLGVLSGVVGFIYLAVMGQLLLSPEFPTAPGIPLQVIVLILYVPHIIVISFASAMLLLLLEASTRGEKLPILATVLRTNHYVCAFLLFTLILGGVSLIAGLPLHAQLFFGGGGVTRGLLWRLTDAMKHLLVAMISFVPVIVVVRRVSIVTAFSDCADLWARHTKAMALFVAACALVLLIPVVLENHMSIFFSSWGLARHVARTLATCLKIGAGVVVMSSMVVFYRMLRDAEEAIP